VGLLDSFFATFLVNWVDFLTADLAFGVSGSFFSGVEASERATF
jgi:hypothetical protein